VENEKLTAEQKLRAKQNALQMARDINPTVRSSHNQGTLGYTPTEIPPTTEKILRDANIFYDWLTD
jgi:hypothetical protein